MSSINPFSGYVAQASQIERAQAADKTRQAKREQVLAKNVAAQDDRLEHQVESADAVKPLAADDQHEPPKRQPQQQPPTPDEDGDEPPHIDVTA
jgi:hypothetical protein